MSASNFPLDACVDLGMLSRSFINTEPSLDDVRELATSVLQRLRVSSILTEYGCQCSSSVELFTKTLKDIGIPLDESQLADIIIAILPRKSLSQMKEDGSDSTDQWNLEVVASVLNQHCKGLNWALLARKLDQPGLRIKSELEFQLLIRLFIRISGEPLPVASILSPWSNRAAQFAILVLGSKTPRNVIDFSGLVSAEQILPDDVPAPPNFSWLCLPLYNTLLDLAAAGMSREVLEAVTMAANSFPEYVLLCMAQVQDPTSGVRAEVLRRTLPLFTGLPGSRPSSVAVMKRLQTVNPDLLVLLFRIALKRSLSVQHMSALEACLAATSPEIARRLEMEGSAEELLGYSCVRADKTDFNLERWCTQVLEQNPQLARLFAVFVKTHIETLRPRRSDGGLLSFESCATLIRALQAHPTVVTTEELHLLAAAYLRQHELYKNSLSAQSGGVAGVLTPQAQQPPRPLAVDQSDSLGLLRVAVAPDVEAEANSYFKRIYANEISIGDVVQTLKRYKHSEKVREQDVFRCMVHNVFDEYRYFYKYPDRELNLTAVFFGTLVQEQLVSSITLGVALRYVLEALRKDPEVNAGNEKMFRFGKLALNQFRPRLSEWPQYCSHLIQTPHMERHFPEAVQDALRIVSMESSPRTTATAANPTSVVPSDDVMTSMSAPVPSEPSHPVVPQPQPTLAQSISELSISESLPSASTVPREVLARQSIAQLPTSSSDESIVSPNDFNTAVAEPLVDGIATIIQKMLNANPSTADLPSTMTPPDKIRDQILFVVNNIAKDNFAVKTDELRSLLASEYFAWFANYFINRISTMPNLHPIYLNILDNLDFSELFKAVLDVTYHHATKLLNSENITTSSSERSLLRNLGIWLGQITLARNKPLLQRRINLKELLLWGFETSRLIAVCSFVAKIMEGCKFSKVFRPPNPWMMAILGVLRELYELDDLKMNIKFEVQVLCKNINIRIEDIPRTNLLTSCRSPIKDSRNPDFTAKTGSSKGPSSSSSPLIRHSPTPTPPPSSAAFVVPTPPPLPPSASLSASAPSNATSSATSSSGPSAAAVSVAQPAQATQAASAAAPSTVEPTGSRTEQTVIPSLSSYVTISPSLTFFADNPNFRNVVPLAVDRAIREIIQPVVEKSVAIASVTTKQLIVKDYSSEPSEQNLRNAAHSMLSCLVGSMSLITCKEPLRISMSNHLRTLLASSNVEPSMLEQIVQVCCADNLELGCILIEKAATEKAAREMDEALAPAIQRRKICRETGQPLFVEEPWSSVVSELPDALMPRNGLVAKQLALYDDFQKCRFTAAAAAQAAKQRVEEKAEPSAPLRAPSPTSELVAITLAQAIEVYQDLLLRLDQSLKAVQVQAQGRDVSIAMLGTDHEIVGIIREIVATTNRIVLSNRAEAALLLSERIFKRLMETISTTLDPLRLEVMVGIIDALRDAGGGPRRLSPDVLAWFSHYATAFSVNDEIGRRLTRVILLLLFRMKLTTTGALDSFFAANMESGRNISWVEVALAFIHHCLMEKLAATYDFPGTFETVSKMRAPDTAVRTQVQKWLTELRALTTKDEQKQASTIASTVSTPQSGQAAVAAPAAVIAPPKDDSLREQVTALLDRWLRIWNTANDQMFSQYLQLIHQCGVLKTEDSMDKFFRLATEICVEAWLKVVQQSPDSAVSHSVMDALSKLFLLLIRLSDRDSGDVSIRANIVSRILQAVARALIADHESKTSSKSSFDQRPYYRLFHNLCSDFGAPSGYTETSPLAIPLLTSYCQIYLALQPSTVPGFAFSWLQLISHRSFMPHLLLVKGQQCWPLLHRLMVSQLLFLRPYLKASQLNDVIRKLYKGTLRVVFVLLHDFPEFLSAYHLSLCEIIPPNCVQLRNIVLSAFPKSLRLPDPFAANLNVDLLPEMSQPPRILHDYQAILADRGLRQCLDTYITSRQPAEFPTLLPTLAISIASGSVMYNLPLLTSIVVYTGVQAIAQGYGQVQGHSKSPPMEIFKNLLAACDPEGRYYFFNILANQLRFPNSHTHYFSSVLLILFLEAEQESIQEQISRVLLERLIANRPHPWGLLVTFIELIRNPKYSFWRRNFTRSAPELIKVLESVARSCLGPNAAAIVQANM